MRTRLLRPMCPSRSYRILLIPQVKKNRACDKKRLDRSALLIDCVRAHHSKNDLAETVLRPSRSCVSKLNPIPWGIPAPLKELRWEAEATSLPSPKRAQTGARTAESAVSNGEPPHGNRGSDGTRGNAESATYDQHSPLPVRIPLCPQRVPDGLNCSNCAGLTSRLLKK